MSSKLPGRREKPHSSKPYDRPKSFLQRVTKHVTDYLPSWMNPSSWVGKEAEEPASNDYSPDEETGEEEEFDVAGPSGLSSPVSQRSTSQRVSLAASPSGTTAFTRKPLERSPPPPASQQTLVNGDDHSDNSETSASTSGCSSLAPSQERKRALSSEARSGSQLKGLQVSKHHLEKIQQQLNSKPLFTIPGSETEQIPTVSSPEVPTIPIRDTVVESQRTNEKARKRVSVEQCTNQNTEKDAETSSTRTSLWSEDDDKSSQTNKRPRTARPQPVAPNKRPCFSVSAFGSPFRIPHHKNPQSSEGNFSPFYQGNTTYGGASAYKKARISTPYNSALRAEAMKVRQVGSGGVLSSAAQKVLNILENMSTPLTDAKKIPVENVSTDFALSYTPSIYARRPLRQDTPHSGLMSSGPPKTSYPMHTPSSPHKATPLLTALSQTTTLTKTVGSATPTSWSLSDEQEKKSGGAVRTRVSQSLRPSKHQRSMEEEPAPLPNLPKISLLPEGSTPKFSFSIPTLTSTPILDSRLPATQPKREVPMIDLVPEKEVPTQVKTNTFVFSSPIEKKPSVEVILDDTHEKDNFQFRSPVFRSPGLVENEKIAPAACSVAKGLSVSFNFAASVSSGGTSPLKRKKPVEQSSEDTPTVEAGLRPAVELIVGRSVMDILGKPSNNLTEEKKTQDKIGFGSAFQKKTTEWDCSVCMVRNKDSSSSCAACTTPRPNSKPPTNTVAATSTTSGFGSSFAPASGSWSCPTCMVNNTETALSCVACTEPKPGVSKSKADTLIGSSDVPKTTPKTSEVPAGCPKQWVGPPVATTAGMWECDACLVRNKDSSSKCIACETPRPNSLPAGVKETFTGFKFGQPAKDSSSASPFKFGSKDVSSPAKSIATFSGFGVSNANSKDANSQSSSFKFGSPASSDAKGASNLSEGFKFGMPITKDSPSTPKLPEGFKFGATTASDSSLKPSFGLPTNTSSNIETVKFGLPVEPSFKGNSVRTDKEMEKTCEVVSSSTASAETDKSSGETKSPAKLGFVFGGQSTTVEKKSETTPTLTFGQKTDDVSKSSFGTEKSVTKVEGAVSNSEQKSGGFLFGDSVTKPAVSEQTVEQNTSLAFKFGAGSQSESKQASTGMSVNGSGEKKQVAPMFAFGNQRGLDSGEESASGNAPAPAVLPGFQFSFKGKDIDSEETKPLASGPVFGTPAVSSTTAASLSTFTTTTTASPPKSSVSFGVAPAPVSTAASITTASSASAGTQNSTPFVFGSSKPSQAPAASSGGFTFSFGNNASGNVAAKPALPFTFGSTANNASSVPPVSSTPFTFGKVDPAPGPTNSTQPQATPVFTFGSNAGSAPNSGSGNFVASQPSKPVFGGFGTPSGSAPTATPSLPAFGQQPSVGAVSTTETFSFGSGNAMSNITTPSGGVFQMNAAKPAGTAATPVFRFGATQAESGASQQPLFGGPQVQSAAGGAFTFGSTTVPSTCTPFAGSGPFVFGSSANNAGANPANSAQPPAASVPPFGFQPGNASSNPFSVQGGSSSTKRPIRKAIRRVPKK